MSVARKVLIILEVIFLCTMSASGIYALANDTKIVEKAFQTSGVSIQIQELTINSENKEMQDTNKYTNIMPSDDLSLTYKVFNKGIDCYVRTKVTLLNTNKDIKYSDLLKDISEGWEQHGEYVYYKLINKTGSIIEISNKIKIPAEISSIEQNDKVKLNILVEAIQAKNFNPDYSLENPWKDMNIEDSDESTYSAVVSNEVTKVFVQYENNVESDIYISDDFFEKFANMLPGDVLTEQIQIKNNTAETVEYLLKFAKKDITEEEKELLKKISVQINSQNGKIIFEGNLLESETITLGKYNKGQNDFLIFKITVPKDAKNLFKTLKSKISLNFSASYDKKTAQHNIDNNPKTGNMKIDLTMALFFISSIGFMITILLEKIEIRKNVLKLKK